MSYVDQNLMPGETIIYRARLHWAIFLGPSVWVIVAIWLFVVGIWRFSLHGDLTLVFVALGLLLIAMAMLFDAFVARHTSEFVVTSKRVLIKIGLIRRRSLETLLNKIESVAVDQGIVGRMLDYGTIIVGGTGGSKEPFHRIADPMQFRRQVQQQIAAIEESRGTGNV